MHFYEDDRLASVNMTPDEICQLATLNLARIHEVAAAQMGDNTSPEAGLAILHLTAALCFPVSYENNPAKAIQGVDEVLQLMTKGA